MLEQKPQNTSLMGFNKGRWEQKKGISFAASMDASSLPVLGGFCKPARHVLTQNVQEQVANLFQQLEKQQLEKHIDSAREKLALLKMAPEQRRRYDRYLMEIVNDKDIIQTAANQARQDAKLEIAQKMRKTGVEIETIVSLTGLSPEMIEQAGVD